MNQRTARKKTEPELASAEEQLPFGELAMLLGYITREDLRLALREQVLKNQKIGTILIQKGLLGKKEAKEVLRLQRRKGPIEGYVLKQRLGSGGMGTVYRATQTSLNREVAIKILSIDVAENPTQRKRFIQEAHLLGQLLHPNLVQCYDIGEAYGLVYIVMEFVDGRNAREVLMHEGRFDEPTALNVLEQVLEAMSHYHSRNIIHRDIKPENILITPQDTVKLADLGLSKQLDSDMNLTRPGKTVGTPYYISPELARGETDADIRCDLYSLGASFFHLVTGEPLFDGQSSPEILTKHVREPARRPSKINDKLSRSFDTIMLKLLEKQRDKRYESPDEALDAVRKLKGGKKIEAPAPLRRRTPTGSASGVRASGVYRKLRSSNSGAYKRMTQSGAARPSRPARRNSGMRVAMGALAMLVMLGLVLVIAQRERMTRDPADVTSDDSRRDKADREALVARLKVDPPRAVNDLEEWAARHSRPAEAIARWNILLEDTTLLGPELTERARDGLERARRALEEEASAAYSKLAARVFELADAGRRDEARELAETFPGKYKGTLAWKDWEGLLNEIKAGP